MKKLTALLLGSSLALSLAVPFSSMATDVYTNGSDVKIQDYEVKIDGTINESIVVLDVTVPLSVPFAVETTTGQGVVSKGASLTVGTLVNGNDAVLSAMTTIENNSTMGISVDVVAVNDADGLLNDINIALSENGNYTTNYLNKSISVENPMHLLSLPNVGVGTFKVIGHEVLTTDNTGASARKIVSDGTKIVTTTLRVTPIW